MLGLVISFIACNLSPEPPHKNVHAISFKTIYLNEMESIVACGAIQKTDQVTVFWQTPSRLFNVDYSAQAVVMAFSTDWSLVKINDEEMQVVVIDRQFLDQHELGLLKTALTNVAVILQKGSDLTPDKIEEYVCSKVWKLKPLWQLDQPKKSAKERNNMLNI